MDSRKFQALGPELDERARRRWAATEALSLGRGGASAVAVATGLSRNTIRSGVRELQSAAVETGPRRIRRPGNETEALDGTNAAVAESLGGIG